VAIVGRLVGRFGEHVELNGRRFDAFPPGDVGAVRGLSALLHLSSREALEPVVERFGELRGYLYFFGLGGDLVKKGLIHGTQR
jgi:hypothetical protein